MVKQDWDYIISDPRAVVDPLRRAHTLVFLAPSLTLIGLLAREFKHEINTIEMSCHLVADDGSMQVVAGIAVMAEHPAGKSRVLMINDILWFRVLLKNFRGLWAGDL